MQNKLLVVAWAKLGMICIYKIVIWIEFIFGSSSIIFIVCWISLWVHCCCFCLKTADQTPGKFNLIFEFRVYSGCFCFYIVLSFDFIRFPYFVLLVIPASYLLDFHQFNSIQFNSINVFLLFLSVCQIQFFFSFKH